MGLFGTGLRRIVRSWQPPGRDEMRRWCAPPYGQPGPSSAPRLVSSDAEREQSSTGSERPARNGHISRDLQPQRRRRKFAGLVTANLLGGIRPAEAGAKWCDRGVKPCASSPRQSVREYSVPSRSAFVHDFEAHAGLPKNEPPATAGSLRKARPRRDHPRQVRLPERARNSKSWFAVRWGACLQRE